MHPRNIGKRCESRTFKVSVALSLLFVVITSSFLWKSSKDYAGRSLESSDGACPWKEMDSAGVPVCNRKGYDGYVNDDDEDDEDSKSCCGKDESTLEVEDAMVILYILGLLYMFLGIAIVCDEIFVPALEIIADKWELSNDVAGATLMAAGGSAPELFTSLISAFDRSDMGFSTIVGSAVFNVLFVIAMCALCTPDKFCPLPLTWWPLARDCSFYILTLITLVAFMRDGKIKLYEAIIQFLMYFLYVFVMYMSETLEAFVKGQFKPKKRGSVIHCEPLKEKKSNVTQDGDDDCVVKKIIDDNKDVELASTESGTKIDTVSLLQQKPADQTQVQPTILDRPSGFRAGILQILISKGDLMESAGVHCVSKIRGDVNDVFEQLDKNGDGHLDIGELRNLLLQLGVPESELTTEKVSEHFEKMYTTSTGNNVITKADFVKWYLKSEERIKSEMKACFDKVDLNGNGTVERSELKALLTNLGHNVTEEEVAIEEKRINISNDGMNFKAFQDWYKDSIFYDMQVNKGEESAESVESMWDTVKSGVGDLSDPEMPIRAKISFLITLPLLLVFCLVPDCRTPGREGWCYASFAGAILFIAGLSWVMVFLASALGNYFNIPVFIMGVTILAAGTSVPDLLSSVIVAKQGHGDMAVSSSIGSNIFDVTVGIPLPWILFEIFANANDCTYGVNVDKDDLLIPTFILLGMVVMIVIIIAGGGWKMTHTLGAIMFALYFGYLIFALLNEYCFHAQLKF